jgi:hemerythrin-like domain-containing protein
MTIIDTEVMQSLIDDHVRARKNATELRSLNADYRAGNKAGAARILGLLTEFIAFYPPHMEKEEKEFFVTCLRYLTKKDDEAMVSEFIAFDRRLIHEKYRWVVEGMKGKRNCPVPRVTAS